MNQGKGKGKGIRGPPPPDPGKGKGQSGPAFTSKSRRPGLTHVSQLSLVNGVLQGSTLSGDIEFSVEQGFNNGRASVRALREQLAKQLKTICLTIDVIILREGLPLEDDEVFTESDVDAMMVKWCTGWEKVITDSHDDLVHPVERSAQSDVFVDQSNTSTPLGPPQIIPPNMMFAPYQVRTVEWAVQSAAEFEERMRALLVAPSDGAEYCRGSRKPV